jgi:hypothetical protein
MDTVETAEPHDERFLGIYSSEELAIEIANLASSPTKVKSSVTWSMRFQAGSRNGPPS